MSKIIMNDHTLYDMYNISKHKLAHVLCLTPKWTLKTISVKNST